MSIYRNHNAPRSDIHATPRPKEEQGEQAETTRKRSDWLYITADSNVQPSAAVPTDLLALRKVQQPANVLLSHTKQWAEKLPDAIRPLTLMREYPRVANMIALLWNEPSRTHFDQYMESLLVDHRGSRQGFPPTVADDLLTLRSAYDDRRRGR